MAPSRTYVMLPLTLFLMVYLIKTSTSISPTEIFQYPTGILPCKTHAMTFLDCRQRNLLTIPPLEQNSTTDLDLSHKKLTQVNGTPFIKLHVLLKLNLNYNKIREISVTAFTGLENLIFLLLRQNHLDALPDDIFCHVTSLEFLDLSLNPFTTLPPSHEALKPLHSLQFLTITGAGRTRNSIQIGKGFQNLSQIAGIDVSSTHLTSNITRDMFQHLAGLPIVQFLLLWHFDHSGLIIENGVDLPLPSLTNLTIVFDALAYFEFSHCPLQSLSLLSNAGNHLPASFNVSTLKVLKQWTSTLNYLQVQLESLEKIYSYTFIWTPLLATLDLRSCSIYYLAEHAFYGLYILEELILAQNRLITVPSHAFQVFQSGTLQKLDLSFNKFTQNIAINAFQHVESLTHLNLAGNGISEIKNWMNVFSNLDSLILNGAGNGFFGRYFQLNHVFPSVQTLHINNVTTLEFYKPLCQLFPNLQHLFLASANIFDFPASVSLQHCSHLLELDLSGSISSWDFKHPDAPFTNLFLLNIARNKVASIKQILFIKATRLFSLDLSFNNIHTIGDEISIAYSNLVHINLESNFLTSINGLQYLTLLEFLVLAENQIMIIPTWLFSKLSNSSFRALDISSNPFKCSCEIEPFRNWILSDRVTWLLRTTYTCATPDELQGVSITAIELNCRSHIDFYVGIGVSSTVLSLLLIILLIRYRWHIKYKLFLLYRHYHPIHDHNDDFDMVQMDGNPRYHAYVAYNDDSAQDERWVLNYLRPNLEEGPEQFYLCIKRRDFIPGCQIIDTIYKSIQDSRKTILVLTPRFVESEWCYYETQMAQMRLFQENMDVLVLILLENIPENKMTVSLRQLLCKKEYLKWPADRVGQGLFWQRLREELKTPVHVDRRCGF